MEFLTLEIENHPANFLAETAALIAVSNIRPGSDNSAAPNPFLMLESIGAKASLLARLTTIRHLMSQYKYQLLLSLTKNIKELYHSKAMSTLSIAHRDEK
jgi:hypothetical protein